MGKSQKPLTILCLGIWGDEFVALQDKGHMIDHNEPTRPVMEYDLVFGPYCWMLTPEHMKYLPLALTEARRRRYPPTKKESA